MSDETHEALTEALQAHVADETDGGFLTDWYCVAAAASPTDANICTYTHDASESPAHTLYGLNVVGMNRLEAEVDMNRPDDE